MNFLLVCHGLYILLIKKLFDPYIGILERFCLMLSGLCHDIDHTGRTNAFEIASHSRLAIKYNDESVNNKLFLFHLLNDIICVFMIFYKY